MDPITEPTLKTVSIKECHKQLEVLFLAVVRCGRHQEQVAADTPKVLPKLVAFSELHIPAEIGSRHSMGFVANDQVPLIRAYQLLLKVLIPRQNVETSDQSIVVVECVTRP